MLLSGLRLRARCFHGSIAYAVMCQVHVQLACSCVVVLHGTCVTVDCLRSASWLEAAMVTCGGMRNVV
jgi:hypothetical protein